MQTSRRLPIRQSSDDILDQRRPNTLRLGAGRLNIKTELRASLSSLPNAFLPRRNRTDLDFGREECESADSKTFWSKFGGILATPTGVKLWTPSPPRRRFGSKKRKSLNSNDDELNSVDTRSFRWSSFSWT